MATEDLFLLSQELKVHEKAVRSICAIDNDTFVSAGLDGVALIWRHKRKREAQTVVDEQSPQAEFEWSPVQQLTPNGTGVYVVVKGPVLEEGAISIQADSTSRECTFFSSGADCKIVWISVTTGKTLKTFIGHTKVVSSLAYREWNLANLLISGSWDSTARVWDLDSGACLGVLKGHAYAVAVTSYFEHRRPMFISGSQDGVLRFWDASQFLNREISSVHKAFEPFKIFSDYHTDIVRALVVENNLLWTCSNDGSIKVFDLELFELIRQVNAHQCFVYGLSVSLYVWSAPDDGEAKVWSPSLECLQRIPHGRTVWTVAALPSGDVATGCEDGSLRIWTTEPSRAAPPELRQKQLEDAQRTRIPPQASGVDVSKLPDISMVTRTRGTQAGQHKLFREHDKAVVFQWTGNIWDRIGDMIGGPDNSTTIGQYFDGDHFFPEGFYDYVFHVEIGDCNERRLLPYKVSDERFLVAEKFCAREGISKINIPEIVKFIENNTVKVETCRKPQPAQSSSSDSFIFPAEFVSFDKFNPEALKAKLLELDEAMTDSELKLTSLERSYLDSLIHHISQANWLTTDFKTCEIDLVFRSRLTKWPIESQLPVFDLWRILALHIQSSELHKLSDGGWQFIAFSLKAAQNKAAPINVRICALRYLANSFLHPMTRSALLLFGTHVLRGIQGIPSEARLDHLCGAVLLNLALAIHHSSSSNLVLAEQTAHACFELLQTATTQSALLVALGVSLKVLPMRSRAAYSGKIMLLPSGAPQDAACISELRSLCEI